MQNSESSSTLSAAKTAHTLAYGQAATRRMSGGSREDYLADRRAADITLQAAHAAHTQFLARLHAATCGFMGAE